MDMGAYNYWLFFTAGVPNMLYVLKYVGSYCCRLRNTIYMCLTSAGLNGIEILLSVHILTYITKDILHFRYFIV
jgi:hypothetical protein